MCDLHIVSSRKPIVFFCLFFCLLFINIQELSAMKWALQSSLKSVAPIVTIIMQSQSRKLSALGDSGIKTFDPNSREFLEELLHLSQFTKRKYKVIKENAKIESEYEQLVKQADEMSEQLDKIAQITKYTRDQALSDLFMDGNISLFKCMRETGLSNSDKLEFCTEVIRSRQTIMESLQNERFRSAGLGAISYNSISYDIWTEAETIEKRILQLEERRAALFSSNSTKI